MSYTAPKSWELPLASKYLQLDADERAFFKAATKIDDDAELERHILDVQAQAFKIFPYPCIRIFGFTRIRISRLPAYPQLLQLGRARKNPVFVDLGCAFGSDVRKAVLDGFPVEACIATDLRGGLYEQGHALFRDTPQTFPVPFIEGDVFDPAFLAIQPPLDAAPPTSASADPAAATDADAAPAPDAGAEEDALPALATLTSLNPLRGRVSAVFMGKFLHLFDAPGQAHIARALAGLLSPEPGSLLFGVQGALPAPGPFRPTASDWTMFCHSPESLGALFAEAFGGADRVRFESRMVTEPGGPTYFDTWPGNERPFTCQEWSVTRL